ncbi:MAG: ATP-binding cassette domain-containing protein [Eubacteriales bacterium]|nr:ATP-binding cassette domain-containing protein [Eubacteriales bacterium]
MNNINKSFPGVKALDNAMLKLKGSSVHALMGENGAGKSTLMKCLFGVYKKDSGNIIIDNIETNFDNPKQALDNGVTMVHQELNQVLKRDVADNIWLGKYPTKYRVIDRQKMIDETLKIFDELGIKIDPREKMSQLSVSDRQMVEIAKAVSYNAKILVLDEPTSSLNGEEVQHLFRIINSLKEKGCGIIYISHKMEEILEISDEVTVMRDGKWVSTTPSSQLTNAQIIKMMVGRDLTNRFPPKNNKPAEVILEISNLSAKQKNSVKDVSFELKKGEILGIAGLVGSKRTELLELLFGMRKISFGNIKLDNKKITNRSPKEAINNGFALITEERRSTGIFAGLSVSFNSVIASIKDYTRYGVLSNKKISDDTQWVISSMKVKTPGQKTRMKNLSGGNQQKVIIGRWLLTKPEILLLDEPTRGIDVGAKYEIYQLIISLAEKGKGVIIVSSEMPEILGISDRVLVMSNGRVAGIKENDGNLSQEEIMTLAAKYV